MMKKLLLLLLIVPFMAFVKSDWVTVNLDNKASVSFPIKPVEKEVSGFPAWYVELNKDARCVVIVMDLKNIGVDSAQFAKDINTEVGFEDFKNSMLEQLGEVSLLSEKKDKLNGFTTFEFKASVVTEKPSDYNIYHIKNIFSGTKIYTIYLYEMKDKPMDDLRKKIYASFKIK